MKYIYILLATITICGSIGELLEVPIHDREFNRLISVESNGNPRALSRVGAIGLCQITTNLLSHYNWANRVQVLPSELWDKNTNIMVAKWYLSYLDGFFSNYKHKDILKYSAYNMGQYRTMFSNEVTNGVLIYRPYVKRIAGLGKWSSFINDNTLLYKGKNIDLYSIYRQVAE